MSDDKSSKNLQTAKKYLNNFFTKIDLYSLTKEEKILADKNLAEYITKKLSRKKYRKQKLHPDMANDIASKVQNSVIQNKPLYFTIPFGGYKHFWSPSHPEVDWSEIFTIKFLTEWLAPILAVYKAGAIIEFISEDIILTRMNNYPKEALDKYSKSFTKLIEICRKYAPQNLDLCFFRIRDKFSEDRIVGEVEKMLPASWKKWNTYTDAEKEIELKRSKRSMFWKGEEDLMGLSDEEKEKKIIESRLIELAYYVVEARPEILGNYFTKDDRIGICFSFGLSPDNADHWITLGSACASCVDFWIGRGILEERNGTFITRIVSKEQYNKIKASLRVFEAGFDFLTLKNCQSIEVISQSDWNKLVGT